MIRCLLWIFAANTCLWVLLACAPALALAEPGVHPYLRMKPIPDGVGVNIHFYHGNANDLFMLEESGLGIIRMDISWAGAEKEPGQYDFSHYDRLVADMEDRGIRILFIIDYGNPLYDEGLAPYTDEGREAYARFCSALAAHFAGKPTIWELWNEPNISFWKPEPNVEDYLAWCRAVVPAIREADPRACIIGPATSGFPMDFIEACLEGGYLELVDGISVHPYRGSHQGPETARGDYDRLSALITRYATGELTGRRMPIISGEWGYTTTDISRELQGKYLPRQWLSNLSYGIPISIWYDWHDDGRDPDEREHNFGTITWDYKMKPAYIAMRALIAELDGYMPAGELPTEPDNDYIAVFRKDGTYKLAIWTTEEATEIRLPEGFRVTRAIDHLGHPFALPGDGVWRVGDAPVYLTLADDAPAWLEILPLRAQPVAPTDAGVSEEIRIYLPVTNASSRAVSLEPLELVLPGVEGAWESEDFTLADGASDILTWRGTVHRRDREQIEVPIAIVCSAPDGFAHTHETRVSIPVANMLQATLGWRHDGLAIDIASTGTPLDGELLVEANGEPIAPVRVRIQANQSLTFLFPCIPLGETPVTASAQIFDNQLNVIAEIPPMTYALVDAVDHPQGQDVRQFYRLWDEGEKGRNIELSGTITNAPGDSPPFPKAVKVDYTIEPGWCFWQWGPKNNPELPAPRPDKVMLWVYGEKFEDRMLCRVVDATSQTFQTRSVSKVKDGWELVELSLEGSMGHWGGANDGVIHPPLRWTSYYLQDPAREASVGTTYLTGVVAAWKPVKHAEQGES